MKKIGWILLGLFLFLAALAAIVQSPWGAERARRFLEQALAKGDFQVQIEKVEGALPHEMALSHVVIDTSGWTISVETLRVKLSLWRLLKRELSFSEMFGEGVSFTSKHPEKRITLSEVSSSSLPLLVNVEHFAFQRVAIPENGEVNLEGSLRVGKGSRYGLLDTSIQKPDLPGARARLVASFRKNGMVQTRLTLQFPVANEKLSLNLIAKGPWNAWIGGRGEIRGKLSGYFSDWAFSSRFKREEDLSWTFSRIRAKSQELQISGIANLERKEESWLIQAAAQIPVLKFKTYSALAVKGQLEAAWKQETLAGEASIQGDLFANLWKITSPFSWKKGEPLQLASYKIEGPALEATGEATLFPGPLLVGTSDIKIEQLQAIGLPNFFGSIEAKAIWNVSEELTQQLYLEGTSSNLYWKEFLSDTSTFRANLSFPLEGDLAIDFNGIQWKTLSFQTASLTTAINGPFSFSAQGEWTHPLAIDLTGDWRFKDSQFLATLQSVEGTFFNHPFSLASPVNFTYSPTLFQFNALKIDIEDAAFALSFDRQGENTDATLSLKQFPIDFLSLNPLDISVTGTLDLDASLQEKNNQLQATLSAAIDSMEVLSLEPITASGTFEGNYRSNQLQLKGNLSPLLDFNLSLPIHLSFWPFKADLLPSERTKGTLLFDGRLENFLDFLDLGTHRLEGICHCDLTLSGPLARPILEGTCTLEEGLYQNYYTGTELQNLSTHFDAKGHTLVLESLTATDAQNQGAFSAAGAISLDLANRFPFHFDVTFSKLNCVQINLVTAAATGNVQVIGNLDKATARGSVEILESHLTIPDKVPRTLPHLEVVYKNQIKPVPPPTPKRKQPYPLFLDLDLHAPGNIFVSGRGLNSEWRGDFHLGGTYSALAAAGTIDLLHGEFLFSSRQFKLTDGSLTFTGKEKEMPYLNLSGTTDAKGVLITARLRGPLNNPQLTLQSTPSLPLSSILSLLLFGQDISEINSLQALQLVGSLANIAGEGPDILEKTRKALGVDRLRILTIPSGDEEEGETIAVQVGKYIAPGIIVTFSQGAEDSGSNVGVEVELKHGFSFQIETQQRQEQGKFILKWGMSY